MKNKIELKTKKFYQSARNLNALDVEFNLLLVL